MPSLDYDKLISIYCPNNCTCINIFCVTDILRLKANPECNRPNKPKLGIRSPVTNFTQVATLRAASKEKLKNLPEKPKKPLPPFFLYSQTRREELRKVHPHAKVTEITKLLADEWNKIDGSAKQEYEVEYKQAMTQYLKKSLDYNTKLTEDEKKILQEVAAEKARDKKNRAVRKALKELNKPKRPKGPFIYFMLEHYSKDKTKYDNYTDFLKKAKPMWENLTQDQKQKYYDMYLDDKKRYELEMEEWETKMINDGKLDLVRTNTRIISTTPRRIIKPKLSSGKSKDEDLKYTKSSTPKESTSKTSTNPKHTLPNSE